MPVARTVLPEVLSVRRRWLCCLGVGVWNLWLVQTAAVVATTLHLPLAATARTALDGLSVVAVVAVVPLWLGRLMRRVEMETHLPQRQQVRRCREAQAAAVPVFANPAAQTSKHSTLVVVVAVECRQTPVQMAGMVVAVAVDV